MKIDKIGHKAFQIIAEEKRIVEVTHFAFAETEEEAKEMFKKGEVKCKLVEEENEYIKNYPKKEEDKRTLD